MNVHQPGTINNHLGPSTAEPSAWSARFGGAALVTGASSGIGKAFAHALAQRGMDLILVGLEPVRLGELAQAIKAEYRVRVAHVAVDLGRPDAVDVIRACADAAGLRVGLLINNAGYGLFGSFTSRDPADQAAMVDVNCRAPIALARAFAPDMVTRQRGGIIFVASTAAYQPTPYFAVYAATKAFNLFMGEALWAELAQHGVEVLALSPGHAHTGFQARSGDPITSPPGGVATPEEIVATALKALGRRPSIIHGKRNTAIANFTQLMPRTTIMRATMRYFDGLDPARAAERTAPRPLTPRVSADQGRFTRAVGRMLLAFLAVAFIDMVVCSLLTQKMRFWFPAWLDAQWDTKGDSWVVYSQSYFAGILFIPLLAIEVVRAFAPRAASMARTTTIALAVLALGFIAWWKGGLMLQHHKGQEAIAWVLLTGAIWLVVRLSEALPAWAARVSARELASGLARAVAVFFLVLAVLDPILCVGVQGLPWSTGLFIEIAFFTPVGIGLAIVARRLSRNAAAPRPQPSVPEASAAYD